MILAGIDEAGYGPLLGPLCVGLAAFHVEGADHARAAGAALRRALEDGGHGVRVGDSKRIHRPAAGIGPLEREVLAVAAARTGRLPRDGRMLLGDLLAGTPPEDHPWYGGLGDLPLPLSSDAGEGKARGRALGAALAARGVRLIDLRVEALPEGRFNESVGRLGSKAATLFDLVGGALERAMARTSVDPVEVRCDRQGGRSRYLPLLQSRFPGHLVRVLRETRASSVYEVGAAGTAVPVRFDVDADVDSPVVGLASMAAKYVRELHMAALNAWVLREAPGVRPTAGYWTDGQRFLRETADARRRLGIDDRLFVRCR